MVRRDSELAVYNVGIEGHIIRRADGDRDVMQFRERIREGREPWVCPYRRCENRTVLWPVLLDERDKDGEHFAYVLQVCADVERLGPSGSETNDVLLAAKERLVHERRRLGGEAEALREFACFPFVGGYSGEYFGRELEKACVCPSELVDRLSSISQRE
jgi:hypothetical protein